MRDIFADIFAEETANPVEAARRSLRPQLPRRFYARAQISEGPEGTSIQLDGKPRQVIIHAPKNGFFFVIDRTNGQFIQAKNHVPVNWTNGIDPLSGRPAMTMRLKFKIQSADGKPVEQDIHSTIHRVPGGA